MKVGPLLRRARLSAGLSFREASALSRQIARELGEVQYFIAPGSLSDYEVSDSLPRHIHKTITLCALYGLRLAELLRSAGMDLGGTGSDPMPDELVLRDIPQCPSRQSPNPLVSRSKDFLGYLQERAAEVPFFLRSSLSVLADITGLSWRDFFWMGTEGDRFHPLLEGGLVAIVNRRSKKPRYFPALRWFEQPLYVLLRRDGTYVCGCSSIEDGGLVIHRYASGAGQLELLTEPEQGEVIGQIVAIARGVSPQ